MDLLLYLITREEVDIHEISISRIVDQYLAYLEHLKDLNVEVTSDFIVMASTLMLIKSKALLPTEEIDLDEEIDQQDELIQHLLEYKKIKMLSRALNEQGQRHGLRIPRPSHPDLPEEEDIYEDEVSLWDIIRAFAKIVKETGLDRSYQVIHTEKPLAEYIAAILEKLEKQGNLSFEELFSDKRTRNQAICNFISLLELARRKVITVGFDEDQAMLTLTLRIEPEKLESLKEDGIYRIEILWEGDEEEMPEQEADSITRDPFSEQVPVLEPQTPGQNESLHSEEPAPDPDASSQQAQSDKAPGKPAEPSGMSAADGVI
jgi:segregation and condensation protein A